MFRLAVDQIKDGMILGRTVQTAEGNVLLHRGVRLHSGYKEGLKRFGLQSVYIDNGLTDKLDIPEVLSEKTKQVTVCCLKKLQVALIGGNEVDTREVFSCSKNIIDEAILNRNVAVNLMEVRNYDDYTFCHSISVCALSVLLGLELGYNELKLQELALGALLHDLGKTQIPKDILHKPGKLSEAEYGLMKKHSGYGFSLLRNVKEFSVVATHIAFQHHERFDGRGYPRGLRGKDIHEYARITALADVFDALISDRPYRAGFRPDEALQIMSREKDTQFDAQLYDLFVNLVAAYPVGTIVKLTTGETAVVIKTPKGQSYRPVVQVMNGGELNLALPGSPQIVEVVLPDLKMNS